MNNTYYHTAKIKSVYAYKGVPNCKIVCNFFCLASIKIYTTFVYHTVVYECCINLHTTFVYHCIKQSSAAFISRHQEPVCVGAVPSRRPSLSADVNNCVRTQTKNKDTRLLLVRRQTCLCSLAESNRCDFIISLTSDTL